jgi:hypothetical protein
VAISGTQTVVGAHQDDTGAANAGSAYVYDLSSGTPTIPVATLNNPGPAASDNFGHSVAIYGTQVVVGAYLDDTGATDSGSAYVYDLSGGTPTVPVATFNNPGPATDDYFGHSVAISGTRVVVGAYRDDTGAQDAGSAYVYDLSSGTPTVPVATLNNPDPGDTNYFGLYGDRFGFAVAIAGTRVVVGASGQDSMGPVDGGTAYVYDLSGGTPTVPIVTLNNPNPTFKSGFGDAVAISGTLVVVGAYQGVTSAMNAGIVHVYDLSQGTPTVPMATLQNPNPTASDLFGVSVAVDGTNVAIGAPGEDAVMPDKGQAYVFGPGDKTTLAPMLVAPASNVVTGNPVSVSYSLPEAALPGSVKLSFGATQLTLAESEGAAGEHTFSFNPANPTASAQVVAGEPVTDGVYSVTLSCQDALGNPEASSAAAANVIVDTTAPTLMLPSDITVATTNAAGATVNYTASANDGGSGVAISSFLPASGSTFPLGLTTVNATAVDHAGNMATGSFTITVGYLVDGADFSTPAAVPLTDDGFTATGQTVGPLTLGFDPAPGQVLTLVNNTSANPINGAFTNLPDGGTIATSFGGRDLLFIANYSGGDGNDLTLTLLNPEIAVEQPLLNDIPNHGMLSFGTMVLGSPVSLVFTIKNTGPGILNGLAITKLGTDQTAFNVTASPSAPVAGPAGTATFTVQFNPTTSGAKTVAIHIASDDADENPFVIELTGTALSFSADSDNDGLSDASEFNMAALGFDWQVNQSALVSTFFDNAAGAGLFTASQVQAMNPGTPLIARDPATGQFKLTLDWKKSTNLTDFADFPAPPGSAVSINPQGDIEFEFPSSDDAAFFRIEME